MPWLIAATIIFLGEPLPDGRQEVIIALDTPWNFFVDFDVEEPKPTVPNVQVPYITLAAKGEFSE